MKKNKKKKRLSLLKKPEVKKLELLYMGTKEVSVKDLEEVLVADLSEEEKENVQIWPQIGICLLYTSPSPRD